MSSQAHSGARAGASGSGLRRHLPALERLDSPVTTYYVLLGATGMLLVIGLVMVLSASSVTSLKDSGSSFTVFRDQLQFAAVGVPLMVLASRVPVRVWKRVGWLVLVVAIVAQSLVFSPIGKGVKGNLNWIQIGGLRAQPSEVMKFALVLWGATVLARKRRLLDRPVHVVVPVLFPVGVLSIGLVLAGHDLGTGLVLLMIVAGLLFAAGAPLRLFAATGAVMSSLVAVLVVSSSNRRSRFLGWLGGQCPDPGGVCYQSNHGKYALADGGWWGVGLGASREKWSWLPEAHNDFIFAIIGEELGLPGALVVLALFLLIGWACLRLATRSEDLFVRIASAAAMAWLLGQMLINVGAVIGMLPVIGVPLPLVSSGGSALVTSLLVLGLLMSFARAEPGAAQALSSRPGLLRRSLAVLPGASGRRAAAGRGRRLGEDGRRVRRTGRAEARSGRTGREGRS